ncbi:MAG TPA: helix-turn-helix transcriptional regulator [Jatrophihabitans sp.]|nr:helix-turn-helix transcriptional regulator [Jatrophihabitans sp.]
MALARDVLTRIARLCDGDLNPKALREQVLAQVRDVVECDAFVFALTDPVTRVATSPLADVPMLPWPRLPELIRWRYLATVARWDRVLDGGVAATSLCSATDGHLERSPLWRHMYSELGVLDTALIAFGDRYGCWAFMELWRNSGTPFSAAELDFLASFRSAVTAGLRRAVARTFVDPEQQLLPVGPAVVVLQPDLQVHSQTEAAGEALLRLNPPDEPMPAIPAAAYNIGAALIAAEHDVPIGPPWSRIHLGGGRWVTVKASRLGADIAVSIEPSTPAERMDVYSRAYGLSERESGVLALLATGLDSRRLAAELFLSEHTVNDHVKAILAKTGARTRQQLLSRALGAS